MFELPEVTVLTTQINNVLKGKKIQKGTLGNSPHKFIWYNRTHDEFEELTKEKSIGDAWIKGRWMFMELNPGYVLVIGECGGKILYHSPGGSIPKKYHLYLCFTDSSFFTVTTQMWGAIGLYEKGEEYSGEYVKDMKITPDNPEFTLEYFNTLIKDVIQKGKRTVKGLLTQDQLIPGLGNAIAQDIMFKSHLHPKYPVRQLTPSQITTLYYSIQSTMKEIIAHGGRYDEYDLYDKRGTYIRRMDKNAVGKPCSVCGTIIEKMQYLGGACYFCPKCQALE
jgi:formamidopyrimidine-DNA glycosylase